MCTIDQLKETIRLLIQRNAELAKNHTIRYEDKKVPYELELQQFLIKD